MTVAEMNRALALLSTVHSFDDETTELRVYCPPMCSKERVHIETKKGAVDIVLSVDIADMRDTFEEHYASE